MGYMFSPSELYPGRSYHNPDAYSDDWREHRLRLNEDLDWDLRKELRDKLTAPGFIKLASTQHQAKDQADGKAEAEDERAGASAMTASSSMLQLRTLLHRCPNVRSLRLCNSSLRPLHRHEARHSRSQPRGAGPFRLVRR
jgi:hypothetical protein